MTIESETALTPSQLLAAVSDRLDEGDYRTVPTPTGWSDVTTRLFEDEYGVVAVMVFDSWADLADQWPNGQAQLVELLSRHLTRPDVKASEGYLLLLTPGDLPPDGHRELIDIRYDTSRVRKLVGAGDQLRTLGDIGVLVLPLLPMRIDDRLEGDVGVLEQLPDLLAERGVAASITNTLIEAFSENRSLLETLHRWGAGQ